MGLFLRWVYRIEEKILLSARVLIVVILSLLIIPGVGILLSSFGNSISQPDVTIEDTLDPVSFSSYEFEESRSEESASTPDPSSSAQPSGEDLAAQRYREEIEQILNDLMPVYDALKFSATTRKGVEEYVLNSITGFGGILSERLSSSHTQTLEKLDLAVSHMVEYVEDMTVYYGEVLSEREL